MLKTIQNPTGLNWHIQSVQEKLYKELSKTWGAVDYHCYGRAYRNAVVNSGYVAEVYEGANQYKEVYWDDSLAALSFFGISPKITKDTVQSADVHLVFFVNLEKIKPGIAHRADEEVRQDVFNVFGGNSHGLHFQSIDLYVENVLKEYPGSRRDDRLKHVDMHPVHCFRLNYRLQFNPNKTTLKF